ncbi:MAG: DUF3325 domain-containing protein [Polaromonas sp.]
MPKALLMLAACLLNLSGFALLALSQPRHRYRVFKSNSHLAHMPHAPRATGLIAIGLSLPACIAAQGSSFGSLLWVMLVCAAALAVAFMLTWWPQGSRTRSDGEIA